MKKNILQYVALVLIIKKSKNELKIYVNYKTLNVLTIKNRNALSFIKKTLTRLSSTKIYNKFNIIIAFNEIKIKKNNKHKIAFFTQYELFKYVVMLFKLCNTLKIFQIFINFTLKEYLNNFYTSYLNDILIYNNKKKTHNSRF